MLWPLVNSSYAVDIQSHMLWPLVNSSYAVDIQSLHHPTYTILSEFLVVSYMKSCRMSMISSRILDLRFETLRLSLASPTQAPSPNPKNPQYETQASYVYIYVYVYMHIYIYMCINIYVYICICVTHLPVPVRNPATRFGEDDPRPTGKQLWEDRALDAWSPSALVSDPSIRGLQK